MSVTGAQNSFSHFEHSAPSVKWLSAKSPFLSRSSQYYPPFYVKNHRARGGAGLLMHGGGGSEIGDVYKSSFDVQRGSGEGFGSAFKTAFTYIKPIFNRGIKTLATEGKQAAAEIINDIVDHEGDVKTSIKRRAREAGQRMKRKLPHIVLGEGKQGEKMIGRGKKKKQKVIVTAVGAVQGTTCPGKRKKVVTTTTKKKKRNQVKFPRDIFS